MGLGKTLEALCIVFSERQAGQHAGQQAGQQAGQVVKEPVESLKDRQILPSLVVCPTTLVTHWCQEVLKWFDGFTPLEYVGSPTERASLRKRIVGKADLVVASYDVVRNDVDALAEFQFNYCILDEGHVIRNPQARITRAVKRMRAHNRLILTGTPIQNNVLELWSLFDFLMPGFLGSQRLFNQRYAKPILASRNARVGDAEQEAGALALEQLHRQVLPFLLRRLKEDVLADLPPKIIQDYYVDLSPLQANLYRTAGTTSTRELTDLVAEPAKRARTGAVDSKSAAVEEEAIRNRSAGAATSGTALHIFQVLQYLRRVCNHPLLVLPAEGTPEHDAKSLHSLVHAPKLAALHQLLLDCGLGRESQRSVAGAVGGRGGGEQQQDGSSAVLVDCGESVVAPHRVLVFAQQRGFLDLVARDLLDARMRTVSYERLDGSVPPRRRGEIVERFNSDPSIDLLLLTTRVGGLGLNLTGADTVVFLDHDWNPMADLQAMDRTHRLGQQRVVNVYRLITRGTLEEKVLSLQQFKKGIAGAVVSSANASLQTMDTEQLLDLFTLSAPKEPRRVSAAGAEDATDAFGVAETGRKGKRKAAGKLGVVLEQLGELWDEKEYEDAHSVEGLLQKIAK